jgi:hypothetical protein
MTTSSVRRPLVFFLLAIALAPAISWGEDKDARSLEQSQSEGYFVTWPADGTLTVIGTAGRRATRKASVEAALCDAAQKIALYYGVKGVVVLDAVPDGGSKSTRNLDYANKNAEQLLQAIIFDPYKDLFVRNGTIYVRVKYNLPCQKLPYHTTMMAGKPDWVAQLSADIPGYMTAVGYSGRWATLANTCKASYENAIVSMLMQISSTVESVSIDNKDGGKLVGVSSTSKGALKDVVICETWIDKQTQGVWTLVAAHTAE